MSSDDSMEDVLFLIKNIEEHTTKKGNDCLKVHGFSTSENRSYTLWVFKDDWIEELKLREDEYLDEEFEVAITDKTGGSRNHVWAEYFWPASEDLQDDWFHRYLKARDIELDKRTDKKANEKLNELGYTMTKDENLDDETDSRPDRNTRIERQASMHFASRIVSAKIQSDHVMTDGSALTDEAIEEELNKWMTKFRRGITTGQVE